MRRIFPGRPSVSQPVTRESYVTLRYVVVHTTTNTHSFPPSLPSFLFVHSFIHSVSLPWFVRLSLFFGGGAAASLERNENERTVSFFGAPRASVFINKTPPPSQPTSQANTVDASSTAASKKRTPKRRFHPSELPIRRHLNEQQQQNEAGPFLVYVCLCAAPSTFT